LITKEFSGETQKTHGNFVKICDLNFTLLVAVVWAVILFSMIGSKDASEEPAVSFETLALIHYIKQFHIAEDHISSLSG
jgi:hypothetical protein